MPFGMDPANTPAKHDLVFAGHGVFAPERGVDDFDGADLRGKAVVAIIRAPWKLDPKAVHAYDRAVGKFVHVTVRNGSFLIYVRAEVLQLWISRSVVESVSAIIGSEH